MIFERWQWSVFFDSLPKIIAAIPTVLGLTLASYFVALVLGFVWTTLKRVKFKPFVWLVTLVMEFIRTTPPLVQIFFIFYAWPLVPYVGVLLDPVPAGIMALGIHFSTYISEIYRSGIESVSKGQWEASKALNYNKRQTWLKIILPQAIPPVIPMLGNYLIIMFKEVPLTAAIGIAGMLFVAQFDIGAKNFTYVEPLTIVGFLFLALSYPSALLINYLERKLNKRFKKTVES